MQNSQWGWVLGIPEGWGLLHMRPKVSSFPTRPKHLFHEGTRETALKTGILLCQHCILAG